MEKGEYEDFVRRSGSFGDDDRSFRVEKRGARRVQLYSRRLAFECCTNSLCGALFKAQAEDVRETRLDRLHLPEGAEEAWEDRVRDRSYHPAARLIAAVAAAWLVAVTVIAALAYLTYLVAMTVEKRLDNLEDDLDDVDNLVKAYHNASCGSFRLANASCAQIAQYDAVAGVASAASTLDAALNATGLGIDVAQDVSRLTDAAQVLACVEINQFIRQFTKLFPGDDEAVLARSSGEEPASPRHRAGVASMAWRLTRRISTKAP